MQNVLAICSYQLWENRLFYLPPLTSSPHFVSFRMCRFTAIGLRHRCRFSWAFQEKDASVAVDLRKKGGLAPLKHAQVIQPPKEEKGCVPHKSHSPFTPWNEHPDCVGVPQTAFPRAHWGRQMKHLMVVGVLRMGCSACGMARLAWEITAPVCLHSILYWNVWQQRWEKTTDICACSW